MFSYLFTVIFCFCFLFVRLSRIVHTKTTNDSILFGFGVVGFLAWRMAHVPGQLQVAADIVVGFPHHLALHLKGDQVQERLDLHVIRGFYQLDQRLFCGFWSR